LPKSHGNTAENYSLSFDRRTHMKTMLIGMAALAGIAVATPAMAQHHRGGNHWSGHHGSGHHWRGNHWRGGPGFGFSVGVPAPYAYACETVRVRHVTPSGRVIYRWVRDC
jgi:hypothetical protein